LVGAEGGEFTTGPHGGGGDGHRFAIFGQGWAFQGFLQAWPGGDQRKKKKPNRQNAKSGPTPPRGEGVPQRRGRGKKKKKNLGGACPRAVAGARAGGREFQTRPGQRRCFTFRQQKTHFFCRFGPRGGPPGARPAFPTGGCPRQRCRKLAREGANNVTGPGLRRGDRPRGGPMGCRLIHTPGGTRRVRRFPPRGAGDKQNRNIKRGEATNRGGGGRGGRGGRGPGPKKRNRIFFFSRSGEPGGGGGAGGGGGKQRGGTDPLDAGNFGRGTNRRRGPRGGGRISDQAGIDGPFRSSSGSKWGRGGGGNRVHPGTVPGVCEDFFFTIFREGEDARVFLRAPRHCFRARERKNFYPGKKKARPRFTPVRGPTGFLKFPGWALPEKKNKKKPGKAGTKNGCFPAWGGGRGTGEWGFQFSRPHFFECGGGRGNSIFFFHGARDDAAAKFIGKPILLAGGFGKTSVGGVKKHAPGPGPHTPPRFGTSCPRRRQFCGGVFFFFGFFFSLNR